MRLWLGVQQVFLCPGETGGVVDAVLVWFELELAEGIALNTGPEEAGELGHWGQAMFALPAPRGLAEKGGALRVRLRVRGSVLELLWPT